MRLLERTNYKARDWYTSTTVKCVVSDPHSLTACGVGVLRFLRIYVRIWELKYTNVHSTVKFTKLRLLKCA